jgi:hypothetical protein
VRQDGLPPVPASLYPRPMSEADERQRRLAEALRANLKRRKAQARGEVSAPTAPPESEPPVTAER